jgi:hypothetical protein
MGTPVNVFHTPTDTSGGANSMLPMAMMAGMGHGGFGGTGGAIGGGLGAGLVGGLLGGLLFGGGNGGLLGRNGVGVGVGDFVTNAGLQAALNGQTAGQNTTAILQNLATIQQLIPENEGRVQLALAQAQIGLGNQAAQGQLASANQAAQLSTNIADARHNINDNVHTNGLNNANAFAGVQIGIANSTAATNAIVREAKDVAEAGFAAVNLGLANLGLQNAIQTGVLQTSIRDDGDRTRTLIIAQNDATLNRIITTQANKIIELQGDHHHVTSGLTVTQTVNQAQAQQQQQQQQQQILFALGQILPVLGNLQNAVATNSNLIVGNTGATTTGAQTANPVNVKG